MHGGVRYSAHLVDQSIVAGEGEDKNCNVPGQCPVDVPAALTANTVLVHHQMDSRHDHLLHLSETPAVWMHVSKIIL